MPFRPTLGRREDWPEDMPGDWSEWYRIMKPNRGAEFLRRGHGHPGFRNDDLENDLPDHCGIYELALGERGTEPTAVYLGSTCRSKRGKILARINEYCIDGSHKANFIDDALERGYTIYARFKQSRRNKKEQAEEDENSILRQFDYAWNERQNGRARACYPYMK